MAPKKTSRTGARAFPKAAFFSLRLLQVFAAIVCLGILGYFHYALLKDGYKIPYEFVILDISVRDSSSSSFTLLLILCFSPS